MGLLYRTEGWRHRVGTVLEVGGSVMMLVFGFWTVRNHNPSRYTDEPISFGRRYHCLANHRHHVGFWHLTD